MDMLLTHALVRDHAPLLAQAAGDLVGPDRPLAVVHARTDAQAQQAAALLRAAYTVGGKQAPAHAPVLDRITA